MLPLLPHSCCRVFWHVPPLHIHNAARPLKLTLYLSSGAPPAAHLQALAAGCSAGSAGLLPTWRGRTRLHLRLAPWPALPV
jgi:hypothetical protein